jgi:hypothetical protein
MKELKWLSIENDGFPSEEGSYLVANGKGWMYPCIAFFYPKQNVFVKHSAQESFTLHVTHYIKIQPWIVD